MWSGKCQDHYHNQHQSNHIKYHQRHYVDRICQNEEYD